MPVQQFSGQGFPRKPDPTVSATNSGRGTYPWSVFSATIGSVSQGSFVASDVGGSSLALLLFTSDSPAICNALATDTTANLQFSSPVANTLSSSLVVTTVGGATPVAAANYGGSVSGFGGAANAVPVAGFPAQVDVVVPGSGQSAAADITKVVCIANGSVLSGVVGVGSSEFASADAPAPIILASSAYTLAMRASDNLVTLGGNLYQIVGLWSAIPN